MNTIKPDEIPEEVIPIDESTINTDTKLDFLIPGASAYVELKNGSYYIGLVNDLNEETNTVRIGNSEVIFIDDIKMARLT